jgi:hypothetical protein
VDILPLRDANDPLVPNSITEAKTRPYSPSYSTLVFLSLCQQQHVGMASCRLHY